jgi:hypothetical protein
METYFENKGVSEKKYDAKNVLNTLHIFCDHQGCFALLWDRQPQGVIMCVQLCMRMQKERRPELHALDKVKSNKFSGPHHDRRGASHQFQLHPILDLLLPSLEVIMLSSPASHIS